MFFSIVDAVRSRFSAGRQSDRPHPPEIGADPLSMDTSAELAHLKKLFDHSSRAAHRREQSRGREAGMDRHGL